MATNETVIVPAGEGPIECSLYLEELSVTREHEYDSRHGMNYAIVTVTFKTRVPTRQLPLTLKFPEIEIEK